MNKICTSIEQSKKLIELGIDINTADLIYQPIMDIDSMSNVGFAKIPLCFSFNEIKECNIQYLPAWSLSALLELMPKLYEFEDDLDDGGCQPNLCKGWDNNLWHVVYRYSIYNTEWYDDPIDAAFEMVCWLKENKKI